jgi:hypothetical protein
MALSLTGAIEIAGSGIGTTSQLAPIASAGVEIVTNPPVELIRLYRSQEYVKVDPELYGELNLVRWRGKRMNWRSPKLYAKGSVRGIDEAMHRVVMNCTDPDILVDHIYGDTLDNRRIHLRTGTVTDNNRNRALHQMRGLEWVRLRQQWRVCITVKDMRILIGHYDNESEAMEARRVAELAHYGFVMRELLTLPPSCGL